LEGIPIFILMKCWTLNIFASAKVSVDRLRKDKTIWGRALPTSVLARLVSLRLMKINVGK
jgi:hypothetical protein